MYSVVQKSVAEGEDEDWDEHSELGQSEDAADVDDFIDDEEGTLDDLSLVSGIEEAD